MFCFCTFLSSNFNISIFILVIYYTALTNRLLLFICKRTSVLVFILVIYYTALKNRLLLFICKRISVLGVCYLFTKDCVLVYLFYIQRLLPLLPVLFIMDCVLVFCYSFAKDCSPFLSLFICKGLLSLSFAIYSQRTAVLV